jgi:hypothetical protein
METFEYYRQHPEEGALFDAAMTAYTAGIAPAVATAYPFAELGTLVDVGGGRGELLAAILQAHPGLRGILFDLPHVVTGAKPLLEQAGVADRCEVVGGDFFREVPAGGDGYILKSIIHDWEDVRAEAILASCRRAMGAGGRLLLVERVIPETGEPPADTLFLDLQMLVAAGGLERTETEYRGLCARAGFRLTRVVPTGAGPALIEAVPA